MHMSDAHVLGEPFQEIHGVRPAHNLRVAVQCINSLNPPPDFCIHTGDSVSEESEKAYLLFKEELGSLKIPTYFAIGNHDNRTSFRKFVLTDRLQTTHPTITISSSTDGISSFWTLQTRATSAAE